MIISDTSALVLNWTDKNIWTSHQARDYSRGLDISAANNLLQMFDRIEQHMHTQAVSNRKFFMRKSALAFLKKCKTSQRNAQVVILAAGIAPLSVEIASLFPECTVFDVDKYLMPEKEEYLKGKCSNIRFISCDITDTELLAQELQNEGWNTSGPGLVIMEGITYYLDEADLRNILSFFSRHRYKIAGDFGLQPECVNLANRFYGVDLFTKIKKLVGLDSVSLYTPAQFMSILLECGHDKTVRLAMGDVQGERTGDRKPFEETESGWISVVSNE